VTLQDLLDSLLSDTQNSLAGFIPELVLCATIILLLLMRVVSLTSRFDSFYVALVGSAIALGTAAPWIQMNEVGGMSRESIFTGMLVYDSFTVYFRVILLTFAVLFALFTRISGIPDREAAPDFYTLVLGATLGMCLMAAANHMLIVFLGVEMASVPSYVLAGMLKGRRKSSEAALKYAVYGAGAAGIMLYGISLLAGVLGSVHLPTMAQRLSVLLGPDNLEQHVGADTHMVLALGALMVMVGLAFKLSAVPFHFWCPDVFEGASAEVDAFLSVASKAAALALLVRMSMGFGFLPSESYHAPAAPTSGAVSSLEQGGTPFILTANPAPVASADAANSETSEGEETKPVVNRESQIEALAPVRVFIGRLLALIAVITCTFGNLAAYGQTNIKRMLAYSTIAHAGYMIMPVAAAMLMVGKDNAGAQDAIGALAVYIGIYLFMNLGAFAVVAFLRNALRSEEIADYAGLIRRAPIVVVSFALMLVSLIGLPPLAGFVGKLLIFYALVNSGMWFVLIVAGLNTALSLYYYLRVVKIMTIDPEPDDRLPLDLPFIPSTFVVAMTLPVVVLGVWWDGLNSWARVAASHLFS